MDVAKLALSEEELRLVMDPGIILTKNAVISKVYHLFGNLSGQLQNQFSLPEEVAAISPKISKGEWYQELPYVMLDYPRFFTADHVLAVRTMFWWGNFFSVTLHLKGKYQELYKAAIISHFEFFSLRNYAIAVGKDEWQHHSGTDDYKQINSMESTEFAAIAESHPFLKITRSFSLDQWHSMHELLSNSQKELSTIIGLMAN